MNHLEDTLAAIQQAGTVDDLADVVDRHVGELPTGETWAEAADRLAATQDSNGDSIRVLRAAAGRWSELKASGSSAESQPLADATNEQGEGAPNSANPSAGAEEALRSEPAVDTRPPSRSKNYQQKS